MAVAATTLLVLGELPAQHPARVTRVIQLESRRGAGMERRDSDRYALDTNDEASLVALLRTLAVDGAVQVLDRRFERATQDSLEAIGTLLRAVKAAQLAVSGWVVSGPVEDLLAQAWIGLARSLGPVWPGLALTLVYAAADDVGLAVDRALAAAPAVYRQQAGRWQRLRAEAIGLAPAAGSVLRQGGVYAITGGAGGLGGLLANYLARHYGARLALCGRREAADGGIVQQLQDLRDTGAAAADYAAVDLGDAAQVSGWMEETVVRHGRVDGVFHCAGVAAAQGLLDGTAEAFATDLARVLRPKVDGSQHLDAATAGLSLAVYCQFSSTSALLGDFGSGSYAAGNRYAMAQAQRRQAQGGRAVAINWPLWRDGGMSGEASRAQTYLASSGQRHLEAEEGLAALEAVLASGRDQVAIWAGVPERVAGFVARAYGDTAAVPAVASPVVAVDPAVPGAAASAVLGAAAGKGYRAALAGEPVTRCLKVDLRSRMSGVLGLDAGRLDEAAELSEFGFDSLSLAALARDLSGYFGLDIVPSLFFAALIAAFASTRMKPLGANSSAVMSSPARLVAVRATPPNGGSSIAKS